MITQEALQELLSYTAVDDTKVVSIYLDSDTSKESNEAIKLRVRGMFKDTKMANGDSAEIVERYLDHTYDWSKPGLAIFASTDGDFFRAYPTAVSFRNRIRVGTKPYVKPLAHLLDHYAHYGVILVDSIGARFYEFHLGELQATSGFMGEDVRKLKSGSGSSTVGMRGGQGGARHEDETFLRNLREMADVANTFFAKKPVRRIFLGGTAENVSQFREFLPKQLQSCVAGTFPIDMNAGDHEVRDHTLELLRDANQKRENKLVETMVTTQAKGGSAALGLDETLQAVCEKRVQTLVISDGYRAPGYVNLESGFVVSNLARSPLPIEQLMEVDDVVDAAVMQTMSQGGHVEIIGENATLDGAGRIGAILRY